MDKTRLILTSKEMGGGIIKAFSSKTTSRVSSPRTSTEKLPRCMTISPAKQQEFGRRRLIRGTGIPTSRIKKLTTSRAKETVLKPQI